MLIGCGAGIWFVRRYILEEADQQLPEHEKMRRTVWSRTGLASWILSLSWMLFGLNILNLFKL
jgi:hypothetical protein